MCPGHPDSISPVAWYNVLCGSRCGMARPFFLLRLVQLLTRGCTLKSKNKNKKTPLPGKQKQTKKGKSSIPRGALHRAVMRVQLVSRHCGIQTMCHGGHPFVEIFQERTAQNPLAEGLKHVMN